MVGNRTKLKNESYISYGIYPQNFYNVTMQVYLKTLFRLDGRVINPSFRVAYTVLIAYVSRSVSRYFL